MAESHDMTETCYVNHQKFNAQSANQGTCRSFDNSVVMLKGQTWGCSDIQYAWGVAGLGRQFESMTTVVHN